MMLRSQKGSAVKSFMTLSLLIAGGVTMYMYYMDAGRSAPEGGTGASFIAHNEIVQAEVRGLPSEETFEVHVEETAGRTLLHVMSDGTSCNQIWMNMAYQTCSMHRVQSHRDSKCVVEFEYQDGSCRHPR